MQQDRTPQRDRRRRRRRIRGRYRTEGNLIVARFTDRDEVTAIPAGPDVTSSIGWGCRWFDRLPGAE